MIKVYPFNNVLIKIHAFIAIQMIQLLCLPVNERPVYSTEIKCIHNENSFVHEAIDKFYLFELIF